jgi:hypothetical protein
MPEAESPERLLQRGLGQERLNDIETKVDGLPARFVDFPSGLRLGSS